MRVRIRCRQDNPTILQRRFERIESDGECIISDDHPVTPEWVPISDNEIEQAAKAGCDIYYRRSSVHSGHKHQAYRKKVMGGIEHDAQYRVVLTLEELLHQKIQCLRHDDQTVQNFYTGAEIVAIKKVIILSAVHKGSNLVEAVRRTIEEYQMLADTTEDPVFKVYYSTIINSINVIIEHLYS